jgi:hypothetical protein
MFKTDDSKMPIALSFVTPEVLACYGTVESQIDLGGKGCKIDAAPSGLWSEKGGYTAKPAAKANLDARQNSFRKTGNAKAFSRNNQISVHSHKERRESSRISQVCEINGRFRQ